MDYKQYVGEYVEMELIHRKNKIIRRGVVISVSGRYILLSTHSSLGFISISKSNLHLKNIKIIDKENFL